MSHYRRRQNCEGFLASSTHYYRYMTIWTYRHVSMKSGLGRIDLLSPKYKQTELFKAFNEIY